MLTATQTLTQTPTPLANNQWHLAGFDGVGIYSIAFSPDYINDHTIIIAGLEVSIALSIAE